MKYKILVTGGAGYIGSVLVPKLLALGNKVTVIDNFMYRQNSLADVCSDDNFEIVRGDVRNELLIKSLLKNADIIMASSLLLGCHQALTDKDIRYVQQTSEEFFEKYA